MDFYSRTNLVWVDRSYKKKEREEKEKYGRANKNKVGLIACHAWKCYGIKFGDKFIHLLVFRFV
jgi:hypothetical protein